MMKIIQMIMVIGLAVAMSGAYGTCFGGEDPVEQCKSECPPDVVPPGWQHCGMNGQLYASACYMACENVAESEGFGPCMDNTAVTACTQANDCTWAKADCCGCQAGGESVAVNVTFAQRIGPSDEICENIMCMQVYMCKPIGCVEGKCSELAE